MLQYNAPREGQKSSIDGNGSDQENTNYWIRKSIITAAKKARFLPMASAIALPAHYGKRVSIYEYVPLLDDRNVNDQGIDAAGATIANGNLYGSSKDVGKITDSLPFLSERGGRVNRVGFTRIQREGSIHKFGIFTEFTQESLNFDSDDKLKEHLSRELVTGAHQLTEAVLQKDLLAAAGVEYFTGGATDDNEITAEVIGGVPASIVSYNDLMRLDQILTDNLTPRDTDILTGSQNVDTRTIAAARVAFIGSELVSTLRAMKDLHNEPAFVPVHKYGAATKPMDGEVGSIDAFRFVVVDQMQHWAGAGKTVVTNPGYRTSIVGGAVKYNVYPILVIGSDSFATIGFQSGGGTYKFDITTKMPGKEMANLTDPYGETGFSSIKWYYGFLVKRPERIAVLKTVARV